MKLTRFTPRFWMSLGTFLLVVAFAFLGPVIFSDKTPKSIVGGRFDPPSAQAWLGSDNIGHDIFSNLMYGVQTSLFIGLIAGFFAVIIGTIIGLVAGYYGGWLEEALMGLTNVALSIPAIIILILLSVSLPTRSTFSLAVVIAITSWTWTARAVRAQVSSIRAREHLDVARLSGAGGFSILMHDIVPFLLSYIWMAFVLQVAGAILAEAGLSILGLGPSGIPTLGNMLNWALAAEASRVGAWFAFLPPTLMLTLISFTLLMLQSSLDEVFNPRLRGQSGRRRIRVAAPAAGGGLIGNGTQLDPVPAEAAALDLPVVTPDSSEPNPSSRSGAEK